MWASSFWGLFGFSVTFGLTALLLTAEQVLLRPWLIGASIACGVLSAIVLCWPLRHRRNRIEVQEAFKHPRRWISSVEPSQLVIAGFIIIVIGVAIAGVGLWRQYRSPTIPPTQTATSNNPGAPVPQTKEFAKRTVRELLAFYEGRSGLEADRLMEPFKGLWLSPTEGTISLMVADGPGAMVGLRVSDDAIECHFSSQWVRELSQYKLGDPLGVIGKFAPVKPAVNFLILQTARSPIKRQNRLTHGENNVTPDTKEQAQWRAEFEKDGREAVSNIARQF